MKVIHRCHTIPYSQVCGTECARPAGEGHLAGLLQQLLREQLQSARCTVVKVIN